MMYPATARRCGNWLSVIFAARACLSASRSATPTGAAIESGNQISGASRRSWTGLRSMSMFARAVSAAAELRERYRMKFGIIGFGNLGRALASGLLRSGCACAGGIFVCDKSPEARAIAEGGLFGLSASEGAGPAIAAADAVFLTVKAHVFEELSSAIDRRSLSGKTIVSFMAGVPFERIYSLLGEVDLVRAMPSLAIATCEGVIGYTKAPPEISDVFNKLGFAFETEPEDIEKVMAFSSCGLGFAAYLIDAFAAAGGEMGFSPETSAQIAALTFKNAVDRGRFRETVAAVATPGGATEQGVLHMDGSGVYGIVAGAVRKAYERMAGA